MNTEFNRDVAASDWYEDEIAHIHATTDKLLDKHRHQQATALRAKRLATEVIPPLRNAYLAAAKALPASSFVTDRHISIVSILDELHAPSEKIGITRIRYYRYSKEDDSYILVDSAGYDEAAAARLRIGGLVKFRSASPLPATDSFWSQNLGIPVLICINANASAELEPDLYPGCIPILKTPTDHCVGMIGKGERSSWLDIPLTVGNEPTGKLSCDFASPLESLPSLLHLIMQFWAQAQQAAPYLEMIYRRQFILPLDGIVSELQGCSTVEALFKYCVEDLPKAIGCSHASIFSLSRDSFGMAKLVLERSSFPEARDHELTACYDLDDDALTAWVARNNVAIRLHDLLNEMERERQLKGYRVFDKNLNWRNRLGDSKSHESYLAVPIAADVNQVVGVIRFTQKNSHGVRYFTERDQAFLQRAVRLAIVPRLLALRQAEVANAISFDHIQETGSLMVAKAVPTSSDIGGAVKRMMSKYFPENAERKKLFLMNVLENDGVTFRHHTIGGTLRNDLEDRKIYKFAGSLTGHVVNSFLRSINGPALPHRIVFVNDLQNAHRLGAMIVLCEEAKSVLACPIAFRRKVYGALIVKSNLHDLRPEVHGKLLELASAQVGAMFARRDLELLYRLKEQVKSLNGPKQMTDWLVQVEEMLRTNCAQVQHTQRLNVRQAVASVAEQSGCRGTIGEIPDVEVRTCMPSLTGVMYSVLSDLCLLKQTEQQVLIRGTVIDKWLELTIDRIILESDPFDGELDHIVGDEVDGMLSILRRTGTEGKPLSAVTLSRMIARSYQTTNRRGSLVPTQSQFVLRIPVD